MLGDAVPQQLDQALDELVADRPLVWPGLERRHLGDLLRRAEGGQHQPFLGAEAVEQAGRGDLIAFARPFIANPRLPTRLRDNLPLAAPDPAAFFAADEKGYTDYPLAP